MTRRKRLALAQLFLLAGAADVRAQSRETLETRVTGARSAVFLEWTSKHQWDQILQGNPPTLLAEYRVRDGRVVIDCLYDPPRAVSGCVGVAPRGDASRRELRYDLPPQLAAAPEGSVCLLFRMRDGRILPIRRAEQDHGETGRFKLAPWEAQAAFRARGARLEAQEGRLRDSLAIIDRLIEAQATRNKRFGGGTRIQCQAIAPPSFAGTGGSTRPVAAEAERGVLATRVCVMRVWVADSIARSKGGGLSTRLRSGNVQPPEVLDAALRLIPPGFAGRVRAVRGPELEQFRRDWTQYSPLVAEYRRRLSAGHQAPHFGRMEDVIRQQSLVRAAGYLVDSMRVMKQAPDSTMVAGYVGSSLENYSLCVEDGPGQMQSAFESQRTVAERDAFLKTKIHAELVTRCMTGVDALQRLHSLKGELEARLAAVVANRSGGSGQAPGSDDRSRELNGERCAP